MIETHQSPIWIPLSKRKIVFLLTGSLVFVSMGFALLLSESTIKSAWAILCIAFFAGCGLYAAIKLFDRSAGLIIDREGFTDRSSAAAVGYVAWEDVTELRIYQVSSQKFLTITVKNPDEYISRLGPLRSKLARSNIALTNSPINISSNTLAISFDRLVELMTKAYKHRIFS